jgi:hypothetical protein
VLPQRATLAGAATASVSFPPRFGASLHLHLHFQRLAVDAVVDKHGEAVRVHQALAPATTDIADVACRVHDRALVWVRGHR